MKYRDLKALTVTLAKVNLAKLCITPAMAIALLSSCATPPKTTTKSAAPIKQEIAQQAVETSYQERIAHAQQVYQNGLAQTAVNDIFEANKLLAQSLRQSMWLEVLGDNPIQYTGSENNIEPTAAQLSDAKTLLATSTQLTRLSLSQEQIQVNNYHIAIALTLLSEFERADQYLSQVLQHNSQQTAANYQLSSALKSARSLEVESFVAYAQFFSKAPTQSDASTALEQISTMSQWQVNSLSNYAFEDLKGWRELYQITARYASDIGKLERFLATWKRKHTNHPFNAFSQLVVERAQQDSVITVENVAILLPLSDREQAIGHAIQDGILSSYQHDKRFKLTFYDTRSQSIPEIYQALLDSKPDFVIGPILKSHVNQYVALDSEQLTTNPYNQLPVGAEDTATKESVNSPAQTLDREISETGQWPSLLLNLPDDFEMAQKHYAFSMQPEDEAVQAAEILSHKGFELPVLITEDSSLGHRIANAFSERWQRLTNTPPRVLYYTQTDKMEATVREVLAVDQSRARISELKRILPVNIDTESRNRRDIDMFYLYGNPAQIQLLKPYIDVNISPFAKAIPIFSSSHSFKTDTSVTDRRDLRGLTFSEMPLLVENTGGNKSMRTMAQQLWPQRKNNLKRLYALGLDSLPLLEKLGAMAHYPVIQHKGYTGVLQLDEYRVIRRSLSWAKYNKNSISTVAMK